MICELLNRELEMSALSLEKQKIKHLQSAFIRVHLRFQIIIIPSVLSVPSVVNLKYRS
jgi:hypothetical protein